MDGLEIIKELVNSLTVSLTNILLKIENINPILNRISEEVKEGKNISQDTIDAVTELKREILSYHESMVQLPVTLNNIQKIYDSVEQINEKLIELDHKVENIPAISEQFEINNKVLTPISKVMEFFTTPIGKITAFIASILAIAGVVQTVEWIIESFLSK